MKANTWEPIAEIASKVNSGQVTATELLEKSLLLIKENKEYSAIVSTLDDSAKARAKEIDNKIKSGSNAGKLAGVPFIAKDNFLVLGGKSTASSNMLKNFSAPYQATAINRLEAEGAICVAKANLDAYAHGSSTENSDFFVTKNPHNKSRVPGGSSGGSATSVALEMAPFALGTDTGGSIRQPASFCGVVGYKPTYGLVSRSGVVAMGSSLDVVGPITSSVKDAALVLDILAGKDNLDSTTIDRNDEDYSNLSNQTIKGKKFGLVRQYMDDNLDQDVKKQTMLMVDKIKSLGGEIVDVNLPTLNLALAVYYVLCPAEVSSNLNRYDGQRYGHSVKDANNLESSYEQSRSTGFGDETKRRIMIGAYVLSSGFYDAYYQKAQLVRTKIINEFKEAFKEVDFLIGPTTPSTAFKIGENINDPLKMYLSDVLTVATNLAGIPAISIANGKIDGLPIGFQIMSSEKSDKQLLEVASVVEENS